MASDVDELCLEMICEETAPYHWPGLLSKSETVDFPSPKSFLRQATIPMPWDDADRNMPSIPMQTSIRPNIVPSYKSPYGGHMQISGKSAGRRHGHRSGWLWIAIVRLRVDVDSVAK